MNKLKSLFGLYFIVRDTGKKKDPKVAVGFMRQTGYPWKAGRGIQLRINKYVIQFGICRSNKTIQEDWDGLLYAMKGRVLEEKPKDIGSWR